jgi:uncharacterized membrane protein
MKTDKPVTILFCLASFSVNVFACTVVTGSNIIEENENKVFNFLVISLLLLAATVFFYFKKTKGSGIPTVISAIVVVFAFLDSRTRIGDCGNNAVGITKFAVEVTFVCFLAQFTIWLLFRKKRHAELS